MIPSLTGPGRLTALVVGALLVARAAMASEAVPSTPAAILEELKSFATVGTVLHIAAHPDDENTQLITYFARGRGYRTAYLSLTRGDGGQNEIGPEFDEKLGVARTQELLAARRLDGGRQYFTRAIDFGFSKNAEETLQFWDRAQVLGDVVRVIRLFRPDVIVTRFSPGSSGNTHGHHTASGILGVEAFKLAGDPKAYPEQLTQGLTIWQPKRVVLNGGGGGRGAAVPDTSAGAAVRGDIGGTDPVSGEPFAAIAGRSRAMHITQGFGNAGARGGSGGPNVQTFTHLGGDRAEKDLFDGIDTTWARYPGGTAVDAAANEVVAQFKLDRPAASVPALLALRKKFAALPIDPVIHDKRAQLDRLLQACLGLSVETSAEQAEVVPGETLKMTYALKVQSADAVVSLREVRTTYPSTSKRDGRTANPTAPLTGNLSITVPRNTPLTQPYWLREDSAAGIARVADPKMIGQPENPPTFTVDYVVEVNGETVVINDEPISVTKSANLERRRRVDVIPPVSLRFGSSVSLFTPGTTRRVAVDILSARAEKSGDLKLEVPTGWKVTPASRTFKTGAVGENTRLNFEVTAPSQPTTGYLNAVATIDGQRFSNQRVEIDYAHIPLQLLQPTARARLVSVGYAIKGKAVGYLPGAGDDTASALEQLGYQVTTLTGPDLNAEKLRGLDAVVIGVRAFNERTDLKDNLPGLFSYVENGGTVIAQYNRQGAPQPLAPYTLSISGSAPQIRVTDEKSPVTFLAPDHPALNVPNKIAMSDFEGWVQERGAYFPSSWDEKNFTPILAMNDPGEAPLKGGVVVARHGKGYYVYTGLAFFRQLPSGVPGAYRLFANLVSLGKE